VAATGGQESGELRRRNGNQLKSATKTRMETVKKTIATEFKDTGDP
jgi:hypothetical protein